MNTAYRDNFSLTPLALFKAPNMVASNSVHSQSASGPSKGRNHYIKMSGVHKREALNYGENI